ncbi:MAG: ATP-binding cassette domain-containing protein [Verrucomicrobiales bacterium]|nr:ATP-binding cassette domain-containing protein [Verrucomicrobiales bacterium]
MSPLLTVSNLHVHFPVRGGVFLKEIGRCKAVDGVSFHLNSGETLGIIGESGCGKTTLGKAVVRLLAPTSGSVRFGGQELATASRGRLRKMAREFQMIFQDPAESLNARHTVGGILEEPFVIQGLGGRQQRQQNVQDLLAKVGLSADAAGKFPFEFSGGQRQRIGIARAIALQPKLVVCDEPVSALDVSVQSQVLNLLMDLQRQMGMSYLFISHNLAVVKHISDRIAIMYLGKIMEMGPSEDVYRHPRHAYTKALISAIPVPDPAVKRNPLRLAGDIPSPINPPPGCAFGHRVQAPRYGESIGKPIPFEEISPGHFVARCPCCIE